MRVEKEENGEEAHAGGSERESCCFFSLF